MSNIKNLRRIKENLEGFIQGWNRIKTIVSQCAGRDITRKDENAYSEAVAELSRLYARIRHEIGGELSYTVRTTGVRMTVKPIPQLLGTMSSVRHVHGSLGGAKRRYFDILWQSGAFNLNTALGRVEAELDGIKDEVEEARYRQFIDEERARRYPKVCDILADAEALLLDATTAQHFSNVANTCRKALIAFAGTIFLPEYVPTDAEQPKGQDLQDKIKYTIRANGGNRKLEELLVKFVRYLHHTRYADAETKDDAQTCIVFTYLIITEVDRVLSNTATHAIGALT